MDIARFLDQPIRFNPRRVSVYSGSVSSSHPPSPSYESTPTSSPESDATLSSETRFSATQNTNLTPPGTSPSLADGHDQVMESSDQHTATPDPSAEIVIPRRHRATKERKGITKAACAACQRRKSKCDGKRPACSACVLKERCCEYSTRAGVSSQAAKRERLKSYAAILGLVRDAAPGDCEKILQDLRAPKTLNEAIRNVQRNWVSESVDLSGVWNAGTIDGTV